MRLLSVFLLVLSLQFSSRCNAQLSVNPGYAERNGLTVTSQQTISVSPNRLRGFMTLRSEAEDPRSALKELRKSEASAFETLKASGVLEDSIQSTSVQFEEWNTAQDGGYFFYSHHSNGLGPSSGTGKVTAVMHLSCDWSLAGKEADEIILMPYEVSRRLAENSVFEFQPFVLMYIGTLDKGQAREVAKRAYEEAKDEALATVSAANRGLGKLLAMTPEVNGRWKYQAGLSYGYWRETDARTKPQANFQPAENEVFGTDYAKLNWTYSVELRYEIK